MSDAHSITRRIIAVLDHDGISEQKRSLHLARVCGIGISTARRSLRGQTQIRMSTLLKLTDGLNVDMRWLWDGGTDSAVHEWDVRTLRVNIEQIKGYPPDDAARMLRLFFGYMAGSRKAENLLNLVETGKMSHKEAARML